MPAVRYVSLVDARAGQRYGDEEAGRPTLENVQADTAELVDVGMVDLGEEADLWRCQSIDICELGFERQPLLFIFSKRTFWSE